MHLLATQLGAIAPTIYNHPWNFFLLSSNVVNRIFMLRISGKDESSGPFSQESFMKGREMKVNERSHHSLEKFCLEIWEDKRLFIPKLLEIRPWLENVSRREQDALRFIKLWIFKLRRREHWWDQRSYSLAASEVTSYTNTENGSSVMLQLLINTQRLLDLSLDEIHKHSSYYRSSLVCSTISHFIFLLLAHPS